MFLPLHDHIPTRRTAVVTIGLIAANILVFLFEVGHGTQMSALIARWGAIPWELTHGRAIVLPDTGLPEAELPAAYPTAPGFPWVTALSSMFMHGGWAHLLFNMLYLWIFGNNVEDVLGRVRFIVFYLSAGLCALLAHVLSNPGSTVPVVGASGAIGGVLGAYLFLFPHARVTSLLFLGFFIRLVEVPAVLLLGFWVLLQLLGGCVSLAWSGAAGVAYWAHIGGFAAGWLGVRLLLPVRMRWKDPDLPVS